MLTGTEEQIFNEPWYHDFSVLGCATPQRGGIFPPNQTAKQTPLFRFIEQALVMCRSANQTTHGIELFCADGFYGNYALQRGADSIVALDLDENELAKARLITRLLGHSDRMRIEREDVFNLSGSYDWAICAGGLYLLTDPGALLRLLRQQVKSALVIQTVYSLAKTEIAHNATLTGDGTGGTPLSVAAPLSLAASDANPIIAATNSGSGDAIAGTSTTGYAGRFTGRTQTSYAATSVTSNNQKATDATTTATFDTTGGALTNTTGSFSNTATRSAGANMLTNVSIYATASGAQNNYAAIFDAGNVGIGTTAPTSKLHVVGDTSLAGNLSFSGSLTGSGANLTSLTGANVTGTLPVSTIPAGSTFYIQNQNTGAQASANFNISGDGIAGGTLGGNIVNATTQYNLSGSRILGNAGSFNLFAGINAGSVTTGASNAFFGASAGASNTSGTENAFFGTSAGFFNTTGNFNAFFGRSAGQANTIGNQNAFFGAFAGFSNTSGIENSFFDASAGNQNTTGSNNAFFGRAAGLFNTTGKDNIFIGDSAGANNTLGDYNSFLGRSAGIANMTGSNNTFLGTFAGSANTTGEGNAFVGRSAGQSNTTGIRNVFVGLNAGDSSTTGSNNTIIGNEADVTANNLTFATAIGSAATVSTSNTIVLGRSAGQDTVSIPGALTLAGALNASGANLTSLNASSITSGTLGVARGGTGADLSATGGAGQYLKQATAGAAITVGAIAAGDIPAGSTFYIQNQNAGTQASANFNISGDGIAGGTLSSNIVNVATQYNIAGSRILSNAGTNNLLYQDASQNYALSAQDFSCYSSGGSVKQANE